MVGDSFARTSRARWRVGMRAVLLNRGDAARAESRRATIASR